MDSPDANSPANPARTDAGPTMAAHLLGVVDFEACLALQQRLVYEASGCRNREITLLLCEHPPQVTVGRAGSRADVRFTAAELRSRKLELRWVNRGGGCVLHAPGQLAIYPIVPLERLSLRVGDFIDRLETGIAAALVEAGYQATRLPAQHGIWGRTGQLAVVATAVKSWVSYFGAYLNVSPSMQLVRGIRSDRLNDAPLSSLAVERQGVRMSGMRERVVRNLAAAFDCQRFHLHSGHPLLLRHPEPTREATARAG